MYKKYKFPPNVRGFHSVPPRSDVNQLYLMTCIPTAPYKPPADKFIAKSRRAYIHLGFSECHNFALSLILVGAWHYWHFPVAPHVPRHQWHLLQPKISVGHALSEKSYCYSHRLSNAGMPFHLGAVLPAIIMVVLQFLPIVGYKAPLLHRITGYMILLLSIASTIGLFIIVHDAFGGSLSLHTAPEIAPLFSSSAKLLRIIISRGCRSSSIGVAICRYPKAKMCTTHSHALRTS